MSKQSEELIEYLRDGIWIDKMSPEENKVLDNFLRTSMANQREKVALAEKIKDGVVYIVYNVKRDKSTKKLTLVAPGTVVVHQSGKELPKEVSSIPRVAFSTIFCLGDIVE